MLESRGLTKWYGGILAVADVSFTLAPGEVLGYLGPNGSGKSTTVGMLVGMVEPSRGQILFRGRSIDDDPVEFRRHIGYVPEEPNLYPFLSGREHLELVAKLRQLDQRTAKARISGVLEAFGLDYLSDAPVSSYSKGTRQKILICCALLPDPPVLILDEPSSGLDVTSALILRRLVINLARREKAILYCSHELDSVEKTCARVLLLQRGKVVAHDSVLTLRQTLAQESLEGVFEQLVGEISPEEVAGNLITAMRLGA